MRKTIVILIAVIVVLAAGAGGFYGGTAYAAGQASNAASVRTAFLNGRGGTGTGGGTGGGGGFGGGVSGTVKSINGNTLQVSTAQNVTTVTLSGSTNIMKTNPATAADLQVGQQVTVRGQADSSGNVTATTIQVVPAGTSFGGGRGGPAAAPTAIPGQ